MQGAVFPESLKIAKEPLSKLEIQQTKETIESYQKVMWQTESSIIT